MGVIYEYFAADSDEQAVAALDLRGGPSGPMPASPELAAALRSGDREAIRRAMEPQVYLSEHGFHALPVKGIDPFGQLSALEVLLTGEDRKTVAHRERAGLDIAGHDDGSRLVLTVTDELQHALAEASDPTLAEVAVPWAQSEDFRNRADSDALAVFLHRFALLARIARDNDQRLYCWMSL